MTGSEVPQATTRTLTQDDFDRFAALSGDDNPIHVDPDFAAGTPFEVPVAHGMFLYSLVRAELRRRLPESRQVTQRLKFPSPTPVGAPVAVHVEVTDDRHDAVHVVTRVEHEDGAVGLTGESVLASGYDVDVERPTPPPTTSPPQDAVGWWREAVGSEARTVRHFTAEDVADYRRLADDPLAPDEVPEPLIGGMFSRLLGVDLPGRGTNYLKQAMVFRAPVPTSQTLTASVRVVRVRPDKRLVDLETRCLDERGALVCEGAALVLARGIPAALSSD